MYYIHDELTAHCFDRAVGTFGEALSAELEAVEGKTARAIEGKRDKIMKKWIPEASGAGGGYRDPAIDK